MNPYTTTHKTDTSRVRWVWDKDHQTVGSYEYDTEEETEEAEAWELERLADGRLVPLGAIVETKCSHCGSWVCQDQLWGIVIEPEEAKLIEFANHSLDLPVVA